MHGRLSTIVNVMDFLNKIIDLTFNFFFLSWCTMEDSHFMGFL
jgi:hypothetical protein